MIGNSSTTSRQEKITIVFGYRDRELSRIRRCLESLAKQSLQNFRVEFIDYGSMCGPSAEIQGIVESHSFCRYTYAETRGYPWNRSHALNIGLRLATTEYVMTSDVDMVFSPDFMHILWQNVSAKRAIFCAPYFLPEGFQDWRDLDAYVGEVPLGTNDARGGCQCVPTDIIHQLRGFDEYYRYWGVEDRDMAHRYELAGLTEHWISEQAAMFHQWHPKATAKTAHVMPLGLWPRMQYHYCEYADAPKRNGIDWGKRTETKDRPLLAFLDFDARRVQSDSRVVWFNGKADNNWDAGELVRTFWALPAGHVLVLRHAEISSPPGWLEFGLRASNRVLRMLRIGTRVDCTANLLQAAVHDLQERQPTIVADYYLNFPACGGVSLLMRQ